MHLVFVDIVYGYGADRPEADAPLGGTTSAVCFLARELVKAGHRCTFFNTIKEPQTSHGIEAQPLDRLIAVLADPDISAVIFCGRWKAEMVNVVRQATRAPLLAWMHESTFHPKLVPVADAFDGIVFVSEWQQRINQSQVPKHWKQAVLRNAMNPAAENAGDHAKASPPLLIYAGGAARGVFHLPPILEKLGQLQKNFDVEIYCNTNPSGDATQDEKYISFLRSLPHIKHVGMVGQRKLIERMKVASVFISPNPWPETSCIALIEAMACGLSSIITNRAALPETASGFARVIAIEDIDHPMRFDMPVPHELFAGAVSDAMNDLGTDDDIKKRSKQVAYFNAHYQWKQRVEAWLDFVKSFTA
ncbi:MAG TPA: glycosyltransferase [Alphaproteobacteria bacterium]|nr:glycosyltransferase [Alphaproteobacteria bacterium]